MFTDLLYTVNRDVTKNTINLFSLNAIQTNVNFMLNFKISDILKMFYFSDDNYSVVDYCPRNMLQVMPVDENTPPLPMRLPSSYRNVFQLIMLNNRDGKTIEMLLSCLLE